MIRTLSKPTLALFISLILTACGGNNTLTNSPANTIPETTNPENPVPTPEPVIPESSSPDGIYFRSMGENIGQVMIINTEDEKNPIIIQNLVSDMEKGVNFWGIEFLNIYLINIVDSTDAVINGRGELVWNLDEDQASTIGDVTITLTDDEATVVVNHTSDITDDNLANGIRFTRQEASLPLSDLVIENMDDCTSVLWSVAENGDYSVAVGSNSVTGTLTLNDKGYYTGDGLISGTPLFDTRLISITDDLDNIYISASLINKSGNTQKPLWGGLDISGCQAEDLTDG